MGRHEKEPTFTIPTLAPESDAPWTSVPAEVPAQYLQVEGESADAFDIPKLADLEEGHYQREMDRTTPSGPDLSKLGTATDRQLWAQNVAIDRAAEATYDRDARAKELAMSLEEVYAAEETPQPALLRDMPKPHPERNEAYGKQRLNELLEANRLAHNEPLPRAVAHLGMAAAQRAASVRAVERERF